MVIFIVAYLGGCAFTLYALMSPDDIESSVKESLWLRPDRDARAVWKIYRKHWTQYAIAVSFFWPVLLWRCFKTVELLVRMKV